LFLIITAFAQEPAVFSFKGVPIDGSKAEMISALIDKGFEYDELNDVLMGEFNGQQSMILMNENHGKVYRIIVAAKNPSYNEAEVRIAYINLIQQFRDNPKYDEHEPNEFIPETEDISYEMTVHNKLYDAIFVFNPTYKWTEDDWAKARENIKNEIEANEYPSPEEKLKAYLSAVENYSSKAFPKGIVWFRIFEHYGDYSIGLYYENWENKPQGEDL
jgi:hypothetical protein